jgi:hypothetical protein
VPLTRGEPAARLLGLGTVVVLVLGGTAGLLIHRSHSVPAPRVSPAGTVATAPATSEPNGSQTGSNDTGTNPTGVASAGSGELGTHSTVLGALAGNGTAPARLAIPRLHVGTHVSATGLASDGRSLDLPQSAIPVVWWAYGARPGAAQGTLLIAGHISWAGRAGTLGRIGTLHVGDPVSVTRIDGTVVHYRVTGRREVAKMSLGQLGVFSTTGPPRLILITCGGRYDASRHSYADNVVVQAVPVS